MMDAKYDLRELLQFISPSSLDYSEWCQIGMGLKHEGYTASDWDSWSQSDSRYKKGDCFKKWDSFRGTGTPVTAGTIVAMAKDNGFVPHRTDRPDYEIDWDDAIGAKDDLVVINTGWVEGKEVQEPKDWNPVHELITYIEALFDSTENVGYVTDTWEKDGKFFPTKGACDRTAGKLIQELNQCNGDIGSVIGDYNKTAGAWIRFNPLDGTGVKNDNVTEFRFALVESDAMDIEQQNAIIRELELPTVCLVHSGKKSLHAIVRIDASNYEEYRKRVDYLYAVCKKNGLKVDTQNKNPSRLSRMPGIERNGQKQFIVDTNIGKESWVEWQEWIEGINDDLPDPESLESEWDNLPDLAPVLIDGVLRQGHKMLVAGPSKAGKSFALIEMCIAIAEGRKWLNWQCARGRIMYVNLELDRASCLHRFKDVYTRLGWAPSNIANIDIWNLRGKSVPMDMLAPKLIRRAMKKNYIAIIIDPIYKVITGDENSADQMAHFCNQFDKVCTELGCAVIYCHHHSKGGQGGKKSMDRASGSGVFARDPDAMLDLIELETNEKLLENEVNNAICEVCIKYLSKQIKDYDEHISQDDACSQYQMLKACEKLLTAEQFKTLNKLVFEAEKKVKQMSAWRVEGTLREFPKFDPINMWFDYPIHKIDGSGALKDVDAEGDFNAKGSPFKRNFGKKKSADEVKKEKNESFEEHFESCSTFNNGKVTVKEMAESLGMSEKTVRNRVKEHGGFWIDANEIGLKT